MSSIAYAKPWLSISEQVEKLEERGLKVDDRDAAEKFLTHLNYYRFSGYCLAFEIRRHSFFDGTRFEDVVHAYRFDCLLRDLIADATEVLEVDLRSQVAHTFGRNHGAFGHLDESSLRFGSSNDHRQWIRGLRREAERSGELFVSHFKAAHTEFPDLPIWIATEIMSFGALTRLYRNMSRLDQKRVAARYGLQPTLLESWMLHLVYVRNVCAHHSRAWDKRWTVAPSRAPSKAWEPSLVPDNERLFATLLICSRMLRRGAGDAALRDEWKHRVESLLNDPPRCPDPSAKMGLPISWRANRDWQ